MAEITYNSIFDGVTLALHRAFPSVQIHGGAVKQDLHPGDFNVLPLNPQHSGQMGSRALRGLTLDVIYYPTDSGGRAECLDKAHQLPLLLDTVTTPQGDVVHGTGFETTIEDDTLHCIVRYQHFIRRVETSEDAMETLQIQEV